MKQRSWSLVSLKVGRPTGNGDASLAPINEVKLVALLVLLAAPLVTGTVTGAALGWRRGRLGRLAGSALGLSVGVLAVVVVVAMMEEPDQPEMVLIGPADAGALAPGDPGVEVKYTIPVNGPLYGEVTLIWRCCTRSASERLLSAPGSPPSPCGRLSGWEHGSSYGPCKPGSCIRAISMRVWLKAR